MRALSVAFGLMLSFSSVALAGAIEDCNQSKDLGLTIRSCTLIIEGHAKGNKDFAYNNRGFAYHWKNQENLAIADYTRSLQLNPSHAKAYTNRGIAYISRKDYDNAIADLDQAIHVEPKDNEPYIQRGWAKYYKGEGEQAVADFNQAIVLNSRWAGPYEGCGRVYFDKGDYELAITNFGAALALNGRQFDAWMGRGWAHYLKGDRDHTTEDFYRAITDFSAAMAVSPENASAAKTGRGLSSLALGGSIGGALEDFNESLLLEGNSIDALWGRGRIFEQQGRRSLALADYRKAIELKANDSRQANFQNKARARLLVLDAPSTGIAQTDGQIVEAKQQAPMGRRVALVIGNSAYKSVAPLANPRNDAAVVAGELTSLGFEVIERRDLGVAGMRKALGEFEDKTVGAEWAFVYYSGHGMELDGHNWLVPVDAELLRSTDVPDEAVALDRVLARLNAASKLRIVVLDACRNNPFISRMVMNRVSTRSVARGLAPVEPTHGEVVFYAARDGNVAFDGKGANSPFAEALVRHMDEEGIELGWFFREVTSSVLAATSNQQEPFVYGRLPAERYYFRWGK